jgi:beta-galactosidase beta subunit
MKTNLCLTLDISQQKHCEFGNEAELKKKVNEKIAHPKNQQKAVLTFREMRDELRHRRTFLACQKLSTVKARCRVPAIHALYLDVYY